MTDFPLIFFLLFKIYPKYFFQRIIKVFTAKHNNLIFFAPFQTFIFEQYCNLRHNFHKSHSSLRGLFNNTTPPTSKLKHKNTILVPSSHTLRKSCGRNNRGNNSTTSGVVRCSGCCVCVCVCVREWLVVDVTTTAVR